MLSSVLKHAALIPAAFIFLLPFLWMLSTSLKSNQQLYVYPPILWPIPAHWENYPTAVTYIDFFLYLRNTLIIAVVIDDRRPASRAPWLRTAWRAFRGRAATFSSS